MTAPKSAKKKTMPHQYHGLYALDRALEPLRDREGWLRELGDIGAALKEWEQSVISDLGGAENISAMERSIVEMATKTHLFLASVDAYLLEQPYLINRSRRQLFPVVLQRQQLADALSRYMSQLGLKRRAKPIQPLSEYIKERYSRRNSSSEPSPSSAGSLSGALTDNQKTRHSGGTSDTDVLTECVETGTDKPDTLTSSEEPVP